MLSQNEEFQVSKDLLEKEEWFRKRNEELSQLAKNVLVGADNVVKKGYENLNRPKTAPVETPVKPKPRTKTEKSSASVVEVKDVFMGLGANEEEVGTEAAYRFLKAKTAVLQKELEKVVAEKKSLVLFLNQANELQLAHEKLKVIETERTKEQKEHTQTVSLNEKLNSQNQEISRKLETAKSELSKLRKEMDSSTKLQKQSGQECQQKDIMLHRALEDLEKAKQQFATKESNLKESLEQSKRNCHELVAENKRLLKQKQDLLTGFRKQNQLIEILKRQKVFLIKRCMWKLHEYCNLPKRSSLKRYKLNKTTHYRTHVRG